MSGSELNPEECSLSFKNLCLKVLSATANMKNNKAIKQKRNKSPMLNTRASQT